MTHVIPPLNAKGLFTVRAPFVVSKSSEYTVSAIRSFEEIRAQGLNPLELIYVPVGLTEAEYQADVADNAAIVTLTSKTQKPLYIPDTYIEGLPVTTSVPYSWLIASVSLGPFPDSYDTALLVEKVSGVVSDFIGVVPEVTIGRAPTTDVVTPEQHEKLTQTRQSYVKMRETDRATVIKQQAIIDAQKERITLLEQLLMNQTA